MFKFIFEIEFIEREGIQKPLQFMNYHRLYSINFISLPGVNCFVVILDNIHFRIVMAIHAHIIGHYNPSVRIATYLLTRYMSGATYI